MDRAGDLSKVPCSTRARQPRAPAVRSLAAAVDLVERDPVVRHASRAALTFLRVAFADVLPHADLAVVAGKISLARNEMGCASALGRARLLLRRALLGEGAREAGVGYIVNLESLFEDAVVRALQHSQLPFRAKVPVDCEQVFAPMKGAYRMKMEMDAFAPTLASLGGGVVVNAKYKRAIAASNLQQVVTYCYVTGSTAAVLVVPAGFGAGPARYRFADGRGTGAIDVHVLEFDTSGASIEAWETNAAKLGTAVGETVASSAAA
jgi:hypothetical protein